MRFVRRSACHAHVALVGLTLSCVAWSHASAHAQTDAPAGHLQLAASRRLKQVVVTPADAGVQHWIPAFAGMTD
jgi:hypothetical protein